MKKIICAALLTFGTLFTCSVTAQTAEQTVRIVEADHTAYYYGHGYADDYDQAVQKAKAQLVGDICLYIKSITDGTISTENGVSMEERISTYTNMTQLREVETVVLSQEPFHVFCYLTKNSVQKMFEERQNRMFEYVRLAQKAEDKLLITDALQYYYWGLILLRTLPNDHAVTFVDAQGEKQILSDWLNRHIQDLIEGVTFEAAGVSDVDDWKSVDVKISYQGRPVGNCDYRYWTGKGYSQIVRAKDGHGIAEFGEVPTRLLFYVEYAFENEAKNMDAELRDIVQSSDKPKFENTRVANLTATSPASAATASSSAAQALVMGQNAPAKGASESVETPLSQEKAQECYDALQSVQRAIKSKNHLSVQQLFTPDGWEIFEDMVKNGTPTIIREPELTFTQVDNEIVCRSVPMSFKFPRSGKTIVENVEFRMNSTDLKIKSVAFMLNQEAEADIMNPDKNWDDRSRRQIVEFLQNYQTAYSLKRTDYLESIFSEDALIIVGTKLKQAPKLENQIRPTNLEQYKYTKATKEQYINALRRVFASAEFVNLQLKDNEILKSGTGEEIYGIQIRQLYASNSYADEGYLFLVVDLRNPDDPIIHVRVWQPDKDPNFGLYDLSKFSFN